MAVLVRCNHCGAPHRVVAADERFLCDYCRGWNLLEGSTELDELVCPETTSESRVNESVRRHLESRGLVAAELSTSARTWLPLWQISSQEGEEALLPAALREMPMLAGLQAPALPLVAREDPRAGSIPTSSDSLEVSRAQAEAAALASFEHPSAALQSVRLIWLPVIPLHVKLPSGSTDGLYLEGADRVLLGSLPASASDERLRPELLLGFVGFPVLCLLLGAALRDWGVRLAALLTASGLGWLLFRSWLPRWTEERKS